MNDHAATTGIQPHLKSHMFPIPESPTATIGNLWPNFNFHCFKRNPWVVISSGISFKSPVYHQKETYCTSQSSLVQSRKQTIFFFILKQLEIWDGSIWHTHQFASFSISIPAHTCLSWIQPREFLWTWMFAQHFVILVDLIHRIRDIAQLFRESWLEGKAWNSSSSTTDIVCIRGPILNSYFERQSAFFADLLICLSVYWAISLKQLWAAPNNETN